MANSHDESHDSSSPADHSQDEPTLPMANDAGLGPVPERIGNYLIRRRIASGGMGTVYEALQEQPRRSVAIKVMRAGRYSDSALRRFAYEAQLLARLRHPGVAQIYEAGRYEEGGFEIPFFAMEYIPNAKSITEYARERQLHTREILELFIQVCEAVHHGHQRGIVHRDLKPGNILVDSSGRPKIIDFGVARATDSDMAAAAEQTQAGQLIGSLQYMSPEQFEADPGDVDIRSDIYALGVVLYELLGKQLPYDVRGSKIHEIATLVRELEPPPLGSLERSLGGDLDTIVSCALRKDRDRRYQSAHGLCEDIRRYLSGAAINAHPPTLAYQLRVLVRRNKIWISAAAVVLLALIGGGAFSTYMYFQAVAERSKAELHAARSQTAIDFMSGMMLETAPQHWGHVPSIADLIQNSRERVDVAFADQPLVAAEIHSTLGWASLPLEDYEMFEAHCTTALELRRKNLGAGDALTVKSLRDVARAQEIRGRNSALVLTREEIVEITTAKFGADSLEAIEDRDDLATAYELEGRYDEAKVVVLDLIDISVESLGVRHRTSMSLMAHATYILLKMDEQESACELARNAYELVDARSGEVDRTTVYVRSAMAACQIFQGRINAAASLYDQELPRDAGVVKVFQGTSEVSKEGPELLVMWETWCPFSQRIIPVVENLYRRYHKRGLGVTSLTRVNRSSSDDRVELFIRDQNLSIPVLKGSGKLWSYFEAKGTPFVVLLSDGRVVWKSSVSTTADLSSGLVRALVAAHEEDRS